MPVVAPPFVPSSEVAHFGGEPRLLLGVDRTAARMVHSWRASLDIVAVAVAAVKVDTVGALLVRSSPADIRLAFHNIVMDSTSCAIQYLFFFANFHFPREKPSTLSTFSFSLQNQ